MYIIMDPVYKGIRRYGLKNIVSKSQSNKDRKNGIRRSGLKDKVPESQSDKVSLYNNSLGRCCVIFNTDWTIFAFSLYCLHHKQYVTTLVT